MRAEIVVKDIPFTRMISSRIQKKVEKLERFCDRILSCHVVVEAEQKHKLQGKLFGVRINLTVPGKELVVNRRRNENLYLAIRDAFNAVGRQLEEYARLQRGDIKAHDVTSYGTVDRIFYPEGFGFIHGPGGREFYFQRNNVAYPAFDKLDVGAAVQFLEVAGDDGPQAHRISAGKHQLAMEWDPNAA